MKNLKLVSVMLFALLSFSLASCGDDDEEVGGRDALIGTWQCTWMEGYYKDADYPEENEEWNGEVSGEKSYTVTVKADGTAIVDGEACDWKMEGNKLHLAYTKNEWELFTVLKLTNSELIIETFEKDERFEEYDKITFKKIS